MDGVVHKLKLLILPIYVVLFVIFTYTAAYANYRQSSYNFTNASEELINLHNYGFCYLTIWNFVSTNIAWKPSVMFLQLLQLIFLAIVIVFEILCLVRCELDVRKFFNWLRNFLFVSFVFPLGISVMSTFWTLFWINRDYIMPPDAEKVMPSLGNHVLHTLIILPVIIESLAPKKHDFIRYLTAAVAFTICFAVYGAVLFGMYFIKDIWLYRIFKDISWTLRLIFILLEFILGLFFLTLGVYIQNTKIPKDILTFDRKEAKNVKEKIWNWFEETKAVLCVK